jgi:tetratricopeptide (TPR) repeat protein
MKTHAPLALLLALLLALAACSRAPAPERPTRDDRVPALIGLAEAHHKRADLALQRGEQDQAALEMRGLIDAARRHGPPTPEGFEVLYDASARLARLQLERGQPAAAIQTARDALQGEQDAPPSLFRGHLHQVLGDALEAHGDPRAAVEEHGRAIEIFRALLERAPGANPTPKESP